MALTHERVWLFHGGIVLQYAPHFENAPFAYLSQGAEVSGVTGEPARMPLRNSANKELQQSSVSFFFHPYLESSQ